MTKTKITKRDNYETLKSLVAENLASGAIDEVEANQLFEFLDKELENLDKRAANAKKYAAKNKASADALTEAAVTVLADANKYMTIPAVVDAILAMDGTIDVTPQKLTYRLSQLVKTGEVEKETTSVKEEGKAARKVNVYRWVAAD